MCKLGLGVFANVILYHKFYSQCHGGSSESQECMRFMISIIIKYVTLLLYFADKGSALLMPLQVTFQASTSSNSNPVNSLSFEQGNAFLIASYAPTGKGFLLLPKNP